MNKEDKELLNSEARLIHESDRTEALILLSLRIIYAKGQAAGIAEADEIFHRVTGE